jgi:hypothetical protein
MIKEMLCSFLDRGLVGLPAKVMFTYRENTTNCNRVFFLSPAGFFFWLFNSFFNFIIFGIKLCGILCLSWLGDLRVLIKKIIAQMTLGLPKLNKVLLIESN